MDKNIYRFIDELKGLCFSYGLSNQAAEEEIVTSSFLYKILNDRNGGNILIKEKDRIENADKDHPDEWLDTVFKRISSYKENIALYGDDTLLIPIMHHIRSDRGAFAASLLEILSGGSVLKAGERADYFGDVFEYLIKDYNVASGKYAEYYTPPEISQIIADVLYKPFDAPRIYDPAAGTGSLLLHMGKKYKNKELYAQDISQKSIRLLWINMLLNEMDGNVHRGNTLTAPAHDGMFDLIVTNPPFKMDFSAIRDQIFATGEYPDGVPDVPKTKKDSMSIYLCFLQHVLSRLSENGRAAAVVPAGFLSTKKGVEYSIRKRIIENQWLDGVIVFPKNVFANTTTKVAVLFLDKKADREPVMLDFSNAGIFEKKGHSKKIVLSESECRKITEEYKNRTQTVSFEKIREKGYSMLPGIYLYSHYDSVKISAEEWESKREGYSEQLKSIIAQERILDEQIAAM